jgi:hypothetical protein
MHALDVASMARLTRSSSDPDEVGGVNREELLKAAAALHIFGTERAASNFDAAVAIILVYETSHEPANLEAVRMHTDAFKIAAHRDLGLEAQSGRRPSP